MIKENIKDLNVNYLNQVIESIIDPLGKEISNDIKWIKLDNKWGSAKFPVVISGSGEPILFLHGFDSCFLEFRRIYPILKKHFQIIIPDLLGFGFSPRIFNNQYNPKNIVDNIIDLLKELNLDRKIKLVGASMGSSVAISLSKEIPDNIDKRILLSPAGFFGEPKIIPRPFNQMGAYFLSLPIVRKNLCKQAFAFPDRSVGLMEEQIASIHLGCEGWRNSLACFAKSGGFGGSSKYFQNIPTKTICGENDRILGPPELKRLKKLKNLNFTSLKNCGHLPHLDLPSLTSKIILDYFN